MHACRKDTEYLRGYVRFGLSCGKQRQEILLVIRPASLIFLELIQYLLRWGQIGAIKTVDPADCPQEMP
jgi:hypothetical protein